MSQATKFPGSHPNDAPLNKAWMFDEKELKREGPPLHPAVAIGLVSTTTVLGCGLASFVWDMPGAVQNFFMRTRIGAQGVTVIALMYTAAQFAAEQSAKGAQQQQGS